MKHTPRARARLPMISGATPLAWAFASFLLVIAACGESHAQPGGRVCHARAGVITRIDGFISDVRVFAEGEADGVYGAPLMPLCESDRIEVRGGTVVYVRINGSSQTIQVPRAPSSFVVPRRSEQGVMTSNLLEFLYQQFWPDIERSTTHARMRSAPGADDPALVRGDLRFVVPGLEEGVARISLATPLESLTLRWSGGTAPFSLRVINPPARRCSAAWATRRTRSLRLSLCARVSGRSG